MISIKIKLNGLDRKLDGASKSLRRHVFKRVQAKTQELRSKAKMMAPKNTGALSRAIYSRTYENPLKATIGIAGNLRGPTGYPYANFVAGGEPITISSSSYNRFFRQDQTVYYGRPTLTPSNNLVSWKAREGWWQQIAATARRAYPATVSRAVRDFCKEMNS
jgi:hypothetical protein